MKRVWYYPKSNCFTDSNGKIIYNFLPYFKLWQIEMWKKEQKDRVIRDSFGNLWNFIYLNVEIEKEICINYSARCPIDCVDCPVTG